MRLRSRNLQNQRNENENQHPLRQSPVRAVVPPEQNDKQKAFDTVYSDLHQPGSFSRKIIRYLRKNKTHSLHKSVRKNFKRRRIITRYPGQIVQMDLIDLQKFSGSNSGYRWILVALDCFSKKIWMRALKRKEGGETAQAMRSIFHDMDYPVQSIIFDEGKEFLNNDVNMVFAQFNIHSYHVKTKMKAGAVERVIKTIKTKIWKIFTETGRKRWIDDLEDIQKNYNSTYHTTIKMAPNEVTSENRKQVFKNMFPHINDIITCRLKKGDSVRIALNKDIFDKSYKVNWSEDIFTIEKVFQRSKVCWYRLKDQRGNIYPKGKYYYQLNKV